MSKFKSTFAYKLIYVFRINDKNHQGLLKVGDATIETTKSINELAPNCKDLNIAAKKRINSYTKTASIDYELLHTELAIHEKKGSESLVAFRDSAVHKVLTRSGIEKHEFDMENQGREWFKTDLATVKNAIAAVKRNQASLDPNDISTDNFPIIFRPEQKQAIKKTLHQFKNGNRMLWNAKMRFGKTLTALQVAKEMGFQRTLIFTHRPVVNEGWFEDFFKIFKGTNYKFGSKTHGEKIENLVDGAEPFVYFASIQDLRGSKAVGGKFDKNEFIFLVDWDFLIVDEAHEGTQTKLGKTVLQTILDNIQTPPKTLELSGTPFNLLANFGQNEIFTWDYVMEQRAKAEWEANHFGDSNPYEELPKLEIFTYNLEKFLPAYIDVADSAFNFKEFFKTWTGDVKKDYKQMPANTKVGDFVHADDVWKFLNLITKSDTAANFPFASEENRLFFRHTLWMVPGVKEAKALSKMLKSHPVFGTFNIANVAGDGDEEKNYNDALKEVRSAIGKNPDDNYSITISCGRLTTGVTVPEWTGVLMLAGSFSTSAANYLQTIFRVQNPANVNGRMKQRCGVFDFAPDRTLKMVAEAGHLSSKVGKIPDKVVMGEFLNYCPVIAIDGSNMKLYDTDNLLQQLKKACTDRVVKNGFDDKYIYNENLLKLDNVELEDFEKLKKIVGSSKQTKKVYDFPMNEQGFTEEEYEELERIERKPKRELTETELALLEEKKKKKENAQKAMSILRGISIRIPLLIYGADVPVDREIRVENFVELIDDASWNEFMPTGVTKDIYKKFSKYYDEDVFIGAGRRIRDMALAADELAPSERVVKIAEQFSMFKNPDKETVLTPWRVVNMHMGDTFGGYNFFNEDYSLPIEEPRLINHGKVTAETLTNTNAKILEINSKTGLYPLYVTYSIYKTKLDSLPKEEQTFEKQLKLWDEVVENNLFVICKTPMARSITKRTLLGYRKGRINAHAFDDLIMQIKDKPEQFREKVSRGNFWNKEEKEMKFDAIVGNPPYQENIKNRGEQPPVYHFFYNVAFLLSNKVSLISPGRFLFDVGKTPSAWNQKMLNDKHFKVIKYFPNSKDVFDSVDIKGGVAITYRDEKEDFGIIGNYVQIDLVKDILSKVQVTNEKPLSDIMYSNTSYKYSPLFLKEHPEFDCKEILSGGSRRYLASSVFEKMPSVFTDQAINKNSVKILGLIHNKRTNKYFDKRYLIPPANFPNYKVFVPSSNGSGALGEVLSTPMIGTPMIGHTETFISFGNFQEKKIAENLLKYIKTKFARLMLGTKKVTQGNKTPKTWINVPLQDFTNKSDIDWSKSVAEIDAQLYKKYKLTNEEIAFIESTIKPMQ